MIEQLNRIVRINFPAMETLIARAAGVKVLNQLDPKLVIGFTSCYNKTRFHCIRTKGTVGNGVGRIRRAQKNATY